MRNILVGVGILAFVIVGIIIVVCVFQYLWNYTIPDITGWTTLSFKQAFIIVFMIDVLTYHPSGGNSG